MSDFLLEIGCENLPPSAIRPAFEQLAADASKRLEELRLGFEEVYTTGAPRRLVLTVKGLAARQSSKTETVTGPPMPRAFDADGEPTKAAEGFAKSHGVDVGKLRGIETERGEYLGFERKLATRATSSLLKELAPELIRGLRFPKMMHWEPDGEFYFARPIRWIVCLYGTSVVPFKLAGLKSGDMTYSIPWIDRKGIRIRGAAQYSMAIAKTGVILDHKERYDTIVKLAKRAASDQKLELVDDPALFDELTFILEAPKPLVGAFDKKYLELPSEVVITAMKSHQRYLALRRRGKLVPGFITFTEGKPGSPSTVRKGNEKVLRARLEDAMFYWHEDIKTGLEGLAGRLDAVVFLEGMGSLNDKAERVSALALAINKADDTGPRTSEDVIRRAALLAKADLASEMIKDGKEFTLLQGLIGSYYAKEGDEPRDVVVALREQYRPRDPGDDLPGSRLGALLSVADRLDTIVGCFLAGLAPTGSQDPYALRRQANGLLRILEVRPSVRIDDLLGHAMDGYIGAGLAEKDVADNSMTQLVEFFKVRSAARLKEKTIAYDVVGAVSAVAWAQPGVALNRARAFQELRGDQAFEQLITGAKRVGNILEEGKKVFGVDWTDLEAAWSGPASGRGFDPSRFEDEQEKRLAKEITKTIPRLQRAEKSADGPSIVRALADLGPAIDDYFDHVLVNAPDPNLKANRHGFLAVVFALFSKYADFSHIVEEGKISVG